MRLQFYDSTSPVKQITKLSGSAEHWFSNVVFAPKTLPSKFTAAEPITYHLTKRHDHNLSPFSRSTVRRASTISGKIYLDPELSTTFSIPDPTFSLRLPNQ